MSTTEFNIEKFNPKKAELNSLVEETKALKINWIDDKEGYKLVFDAKNKLVKTRTWIDKTAKELTLEARAFTLKVWKAKKELLSIILPEEERLKDELQKIKDEEGRLKAEEKEKEKILFEKRVERLAEIESVPTTLFILSDMDDKKFEEYYQENKIKYEQKQKELVSTNFINSSSTLAELEELTNDENFYSNENVENLLNNKKESIQEKLKADEEKRKLILINKINSTTTLEQLNKINPPDDDKIYNERKKFLTEQVEQKRINNSINLINSCTTLEQLKGLKNIEDTEKVKEAYKNRISFLEQQEELQKMKKEKLEAEKLEKEKLEKDKLEKEELEAKKLRRKQLFIAQISSCNSEEELKNLYFNNDSSDLLEECKYRFTEKKLEITEQEKEEQAEKKFQEYLEGIWYNKEKDIIRKDTNWNKLIYKLIWTYND